MKIAGETAPGQHPNINYIYFVGKGADSSCMHVFIIFELAQVYSLEIETYTSLDIHMLLS